ncbi:AAA family ATPase [Kitasatospora sp. NBC_01560]|uniref:Clp protease N-terminal domain-containing protein n=1 Tax=Kitasatospora sp. NBC_01560 TaxID=2975965 RepID=UPI00386E737A
MFERFTEGARQVVVLAQEEARRLNHNYLGTEHLLLGMLHEGAGVAAEALGSSGISLQAVREKVEEIIGLGQEAPAALLPFTPRAKKVLELSLREMTQAGRSHIGTEHLLLGLIREGEGVAAQVLLRLGADFKRVHGEVMQILARPVTEPSPPPPSRTPLLDRLGRDLTHDAAAQQLFPVVGRTAEIEQIALTLSRRRRNVPLLVGDPGVGKASVIAGLAHAVAAGTAPVVVAGRPVHSLDVGALFTDPQYHGRFAEVITGLLTELRHTTGIVLFLDNALTLLHTPDGRAEALAFFRPVLGTPGVSVIAACTTSEYRRREPAPGLDDHLQVLEIGELSADEVQEVLARTRPRLESHHGVAITDEALRAAAELAREHLTGQTLPGSAIDLLDQAGAVAGARPVVRQTDPFAQEYMQQLAERRRYLDSATASQDLVLARHYADEIQQLVTALAEHRRRSTPDSRQVTAAEVAEALSAYAGLPSTLAPPSPPRPRQPQPGPHDPSVWSMS